jgi:hypothetical protein
LPKETEETKHATLSWEQNIKMFLRYIADPGFPKCVEELGG